MFFKLSYHIIKMYFINDAEFNKLLQKDKSEILLMENMPYGIYFFDFFESIEKFESKLSFTMYNSKDERFNVFIPSSLIFDLINNGMGHYFLRLSSTLFKGSYEIVKSPFICRNVPKNTTATTATTK